MTPPTALQNSGKAPRRWSHLEWHLKEGGRVLGTTAPDPLLGSFMQVSPCSGWERELRTPTPLRWIPVGRGTVRGLGSGLRNRGSPRESPAQLGAGRRQKATCSQDACAFSNIPTAALWGHLHPQSHTKPARVELGGLSNNRYSQP